MAHAGDDKVMQALLSPDFHLHVWTTLLEADEDELLITKDPERRVELQENMVEAEKCIQALLVDRDAMERRKEFRLILGGREPGTE